MFLTTQVTSSEFHASNAALVHCKTKESTIPTLWETGLQNPAQLANTPPPPFQRRSMLAWGVWLSCLRLIASVLCLAQIFPEAVMALQECNSSMALRDCCRSWIFSPHRTVLLKPFTFLAAPSWTTNISSQLESGLSLQLLG